MIQSVPLVIAPVSHQQIAVPALQPLQFFSGEFLYLALVFFVLAILAAFVGARGVAGISMEIARIFVILFVILAIVALLF